MIDFTLISSIEELKKNTGLSDDELISAGFVLPTEWDMCVCTSEILYTTQYLPDLYEEGVMIGHDVPVNEEAGWLLASLLRFDHVITPIDYAEKHYYFSSYRQVEEDISNEYSE